MSGRGIPTARSVDHVGVTVPDLEEAVDFFVRVLGCELLYRTRRAFDDDGDWMARHYGVDARAALTTAMLRCGPLTNVELLSWELPAGSPPPADRTSAGVAHLAIYVDDLDAAARYLAAHPGVRVLGPPTVVVGEPNEGAAFVNVLVPGGLCLELVKWPPLMPYCATTDARLLRPAASWNAASTSATSA
jgi:catechol 2,3-dioxygenase-like lactoylglutathione lyase family enzyme